MCLCVYVCIHMSVSVSKEGRRRNLTPWGCSSRQSWAAQHEGLESNPSTPEKQEALLISEPSLWLLRFTFMHAFFPITFSDLPKGFNLIFKLQSQKESRNIIPS